MRRKMIEEKINEILDEENKKVLLEVKSDRLFHDLFNENEMDTIEWAVMQILKADYEDIHGKVKVSNVRLTNTFQEATGKYVDLIVDYKGDKIIIQLNNNCNGNYMKDLLYAFNAIRYHYHDGSGNNVFDHKKIKVVLVNLNWYDNKKLGNEIKSKVEHIFEFPDERFENEYLLKILNINLDFYKNACYPEIDKWDRLWKLVTIDCYDNLKEFTKSEELLQNYQKKLYSLSNDKDYMKMLLNDSIIENDEREAYFNAGYSDGMEEGLQEGIAKGLYDKQLYNVPISMDI